jgi:hypothetical protein
MTMNIKAQAQRVLAISTGTIALVLGTIIVRTWMAPAPVHDQLVEAAATIKHGLPIKADDETTQRDVRVEGNRLIYVYDVTFSSMNAEAQSILTQRVCASNDMRKAITQGVSYGYEYWNAGSRIGEFTVTSCA